MNDDARLLRRYADEGSETAFTELVRRRVDLVYGAALRRTGGDSHRAAEVAQQVFTTLAREARKLSRHAVLSAWLHTATRNAALNLMISEQRRRTREAEALALDPTFAGGEASPDWDQLRPVLDAAIDELADADRAAVVLRFLERRAFAEIGATLAISEDAARMRTDRALDKLRAGLARRGITSTAAALGAIISSQPLVSAPAGLGAALASQALATAGVSAGILATALLSFMNTKIIVAVALAALAGWGAGAYFGLSRELAVPLAPVETPAHSQLIASLRRSNQSLRAEVDRLNADALRLAAAHARLTAPRAVSPPPAALHSTGPALTIGAQQRAMLNNLRQLAAAADQFKLENGRWPTSVDEIVGEKKYVKRITPIDGENYTGLSMLPGQALVVTTPAGVSVTYDPEGRSTTVPQQSPAEARVAELSRRLEPAGRKALDAYRAAHGGNRPPDSNMEALIPYFATPQEGADFVEFIEARKAAGQ